MTASKWISALGGVAALLIGIQIYFWVSTLSLLHTPARKEESKQETVEVLKKAGGAFAQVLTETKDAKPATVLAREHFAASREEALARFETLSNDPKWEKGFHSVKSYFDSNGSKVDQDLTIALAAGEMAKNGDPEMKEARSFAFGVLMENPVEAIRSVRRAALRLDTTSEAVSYRGTLTELTELLIQTPGIEEPGVKDDIAEIRKALSARTR